MNERFIKLGLESGMLNYVDHETPRHYFLCGNADEECLEKFAELIIQDCVRICNKVYFDNYPDAEDFERSEEGEAIKQHFGVQ